MNLVKIVINFCKNYKFCYSKLIKGIRKLSLGKLRANELAAVFFIYVIMWGNNNDY